MIQGISSHYGTDLERNTRTRLLVMYDSSEFNAAYMN